MIDNTYKIELEKQWREKFPATLVGLFAFYQCLCIIAILGCEIGSILIDLFNATIYVGIWASLFFIIACISQVVAVSCRRTHKCAMYTLVIHCITLFFAACVIGFDAYFLIYPTACFFPSTLCSSAAPLRGLYYSEEHFNDIKIPLIKGQLASAAILFAFSIDYIIIYIVIRVHIKNNTRSLIRPFTTDTTNAVVSNTNRNIANSTSLPMINENRPTTIDIQFDASLVKSTNRSRWSMDSVDLSPVEI